MRRAPGIAVVVAVLAMLLVPIRSTAQGPTSPPGAPTSVTATSGTLSATVHWSPSGAAADSFTVTSNPGAITTTVDGTATSATVTGLGYLLSYTFTVTGTNSLGASPASAASNPITPGPPGGAYHQGVQVVLIDRDVSAGRPLATNFGDDPAHLPGVAAVVVNVTVSRATMPAAVQAVVNQAVLGAITVAPGQVQSSLQVIAIPSQLSQASLQVTAGTAHVEMDFVGYFTGASSVKDHGGFLTMIAPATLTDTTVAAGSRTDIPVLGMGGLPPAHVGEVLLNVTATNAAGAGVFTLVPTGGFAAGTSTIGFAAGQTTANRAIVAVPSNGSISVFDTGAAATLHIDALGWFSDGTDTAAIGGLYNPLPTARLVDTSTSGGPVAAGATLTFPVYGQGGAPQVTAIAPPTSAIVTITAVAATGSGSVSIAGTTALDFGAGQTGSRTSVVHLASDGSVTLTVAGSATNVTVDLIGFFAGDLIVPGSTKVMTPELLASITKLSDGADFVMFKPGTQISPFIRLNDVIVAGTSATTPQGFLLRVRSMTTQSDGSIVLGTRQAALSEALTAFAFDGVIVPSFGRFGMRSNHAGANAPQVTVGLTVNPCPGPPPNTSIDPNCPDLSLRTLVLLANSVTPGTFPSPGADGAVHLTPVPWVDLALTDLDLQVLPHFHVEYNFSNNTAKAFFAFSIGFKMAVELSVTKDLINTSLGLPSVTITPDPLAHFTFFIGPVPVVITPTITVAVTMDASISVGLRVAYHFDKWSEISESFDGNSFHAGNIPDKTYVNGFDQPAFEGDAQAKVAYHVGPGLTFYQFCVPVPIINQFCINPFTVGVDLSRFLKASATVTCTLQPSCFPNPWWALSTGLCIGVFMKVSLLFVVDKYFQQDLACAEQVLLQAPGPRLNVVITPSSATVPRFHAQHFHAVVSNSPSGVSFSVEGGDAHGTLSNLSGTTDVDYTAPATPGDYRLLVAALDDPTSVAVANIHVPADPPSVPTAVSAALAGTTSVSVTWGTPSDNGGEPITDYKVVSSDGTTIDAGLSTTSTFNGLNPGTTYTFSVYATNSANLTSAAAVSPAITVPPATPVTVQPPSVDFGTVPLNQVSAPQTVTVFATNVRALTISTLTMGGARPQDYTIQSDNCSGQVVPAGGSCTFAVLFTANAQGPSSAFVQINDDDPTSPQSVSLKAQVPAVVVVAACYLNTIAGGDRNTIVVDPTGKVFTWGANQFGQLGNGTNTPSNLPVTVSTSTGLPAVSEVSSGFYDTVVRATDGTVWAWGDNSSGGLGNTAFPSGSNQPVQVQGAGGSGFLTGVSDVSTGGFEFSVAVKSADGSVWAWGLNADGELGNGTTTNSATPVQVKGPGGVGFLTGIVKVQAGDRHVVALKSDGSVWAWGINSGGELGDNATTAMETTPVQVVGPNGVGLLTGIIAIGSHSFHTVAVRSDGTLVAWGNDPYGQLGDGTTPPSGPFNIPHPVVVSTISGLTNKPSVATGTEHSLAADPTTGKAWAWGWNAYGQIADPTLSQRLTPSQVVAAANFTEVAAGAWHSVGLGSDGSVWTWGQNLYGQLGNGRTDVGSSFNSTPHVVNGVTAAQPGACPPPMTPGVTEMADIQMIDGQHGFAVDTTGVLSTNNGGSAWFREQMPADAQIVPSQQGLRRPGRVHFVDATHGWVLACTVASCAPLVIGTTDGGATWHDVATLPSTLNATEMWWTDLQHGWVLGWTQGTPPSGFAQGTIHINTLYATVDGGQTWQLQTLPGPSASSCPLESDLQPGIKFADPQNGWVASEALCYQATSPFTFIGTLGFAWTTSDSGATWVQHAMPAAVSVVFGQRLQVLSSTEMRVLGRMTLSPGVPSPAIITTDNGGATFNVVQLPFDTNDMRFMDATHAIAIGQSTNLFYRSADGGQTWTQVTNMPSPLPPPNLIQFIQYDLLEFTDANNIWMAGGASYPNSDPGLIEKSSDGGVTWTVQLMGVGT